MPYSDRPLNIWPISMRVPGQLNGTKKPPGSGRRFQPALASAHPCYAYVSRPDGIAPLAAAAPTPSARTAAAASFGNAFMGVSLLFGGGGEVGERANRGFLGAVGHRIAVAG
jgi:hypothetical protein